MDTADARFSFRHSRWRTWLRARTPIFLYERGLVLPKAADCGAHVWHNRGEGVDACYHCEMTRWTPPDAPWHDGKIRTGADVMAYLEKHTRPYEPGPAYNELVDLIVWDLSAQLAIRHPEPKQSTSTGYVITQEELRTTAEFLAAAIETHLDVRAKPRRQAEGERKGAQDGESLA